MIDLMQYDGLTDVFSGNLMGITAENISKQFNITRQMQDEFAVKSHQKAAFATENSYFKEEIIPIEVINKKQTTIFDKDENIRPETTFETLAKLRPAFDKDGVVTAGNSSAINDGAACLMVASEDAVKQHGLGGLN